MAFDINAFLNKLDEDRTKQSNFGDHAKRMMMNSADYQGVCMFVIFPDQKTKEYYVKLPGVLEYKCYNTKREADVWHKILPKPMYGELSKEDSELYDEVVNYWNFMNDNEVLSYNELRKRNYVLIYGHIIRHRNTSGVDVKDSNGSDALLIYPSNAVVDSIGKAIKDKITSLDGNREWIYSVLSDSPVNRDAAVVINFTGGKGGYDSNVSFEFNSAFGKVIPSDLDLTESKKKFTDAVGDFLSWQNPDDHKSYFNREVFAEMRINMMNILNPGQAPDPADNKESHPGEELKSAEQEVSSAQSTNETPSLDKKTGAPF